MKTCRNGHAKIGSGECKICRRASANRAQAKYGRTEKGKATHHRYAQTDKGRWTRDYAHRRWLQDNHEEHNERRRIKHALRHALKTSALKGKG